MWCDPNNLGGNLRTWSISSTRVLSNYFRVCNHINHLWFINYSIYSFLLPNFFFALYAKKNLIPQQSKPIPIRKNITKFESKLVKYLNRFKILVSRELKLNLIYTKIFWIHEYIRIRFIPFVYLLFSDLISKYIFKIRYQKYLNNTQNTKNIWNIYCLFLGLNFRLINQKIMDICKEVKLE